MSELALESVFDVLCVRDLAVCFDTPMGQARAVRGVSFDVKSGRTVAVLGESGCGKSVTARAIVNLIEAPGRIESGTIEFRPDSASTSLNLAAFDSDSDAMRRIRWAQIAMIFQDPVGSLTPVYTIGDQIVEAIRTHEPITKSAARKRAAGLLAEVGLASAQQRLDDYPYELSGGQCQRVMIAMALACHPSLIIADEPTTALDVTIQGQIIDLLRRVQRDHNTSILFITHDIDLVAELADDVVVMYLGKVVERGPVSAVFDNPQHPYTQKLLSSVPRPGMDRSQPLPSIVGRVPDLYHLPVGCPFRGRCPEEFDKCEQQPQLLGRDPKVPEHLGACWR